MATIYLTEQGSKLSKTSKRLVIEKDGQTLLEIPEFKVERVLIFGNVQITTQAMAFLLDNGIEVSFLSLYGKYRGRLSPVESKNAQLRIHQYQKHLDAEFKVSLAKSIVHAKLNNGRELLMRYARNHPEIDFSQDKTEMEDCISRLDHKESVNSVMGVEGAAASVYFEAFGKMLRKELGFEGRQRRPPKDPVNALLSLGYTLIGNEMHSLICAVGFDPYIGFFHGIDYGRPSLALDLIEPFRHAIIDRFTLYLVNNFFLFFFLVQYSVFECILEKELLSEMVNTLTAHINHEEDSIRFYILCKGCITSVKMLGKGELTEDKDVFII